MAKTSHRVFALVFAFLFFATSVATAAVVIWQVHEQNKADKSSQDATKALQDAASQLQTSNGQQTQTEEGKLEGTKLADFTPVTTVDKLQIIDTQEGTGAVVGTGATITAHYTGAVAATGVIFQSSHDSGQPVQFSLNGVIKGWTDGVPGMKVGGKRRLLIPADQAYGANPPAGSGIPANAALVFDIELVSMP